MSFKFKGKITKVLEIEKGTSKAGKDWQKMSFVVDNGEQYNNILCFGLFGSEKIENFNKYNKEGDNVEVSFNVNCNEYNGKYYTSLDAWKVFKEDNSNNSGNNIEEDSSDDLPF